MARKKKPPEAEIGYSDEDAPIIQEAKDAFKEAEVFETENRDRGRENLRFSRLGEQWSQSVKRERERDGRPMLTINRMPAFIRQVVNDARMNKPSIRVKPVDSGADIATAKIYDGIIRNIEASSNADVAYDTGIEDAVSIGFGYWRIDIDYAHDDTFDLDLKISPIRDPFSVYGDPFATSVDGHDWESAFVVERMPTKRFERDFPKATRSSWEAENGQADKTWFNDEGVQVAEWWKRERILRNIMRLSDGAIIDVKRLEDPDFLEELEIKGVTPTDDIREVPSHKVTQYILTGVEVLEANEWPGRHIPIVPVYGDEVNEDGKRHFLALTHFAKDPQRQLNFWRTAAAELIALAPRTPFIGEEGSFAGVDAEKWATANSRSWPTLSYPKGSAPPQRQQMDQSAFGAIQNAMQASDDLKAVTGLYDAALGARSNETSGKAIMARQREGDVSTFHFIDNLTRSVRQSGRILLDLIPHVWPDERVVRLLGEDGSISEQTVNAPVPVVGPDGKPMLVPDPVSGQMVPQLQTFSLTSGKYDLTASAGPSFTTKREEAATQMMELLQYFPQAASVIGDLLVKNLDWPQADKIAERLEALLPSQINTGIPPELQEQIQEGMARIEELEAQNQELQMSKEIDAAKLQLEQMKAQAKEAETMAKLSHEQVQLRTEVNQEQMKLNLERQEMAKDAAIETSKLEVERRKLELEEQKLTIAAYEAETARLQAELAASQPTEQPPQQPQTDPAMAEALKAIAASLTAPKRLVRDSQNRIIGAETETVN